MALIKLITHYTADSSLASIVTTAVFILLPVIYYWIKNRGVLPGPKGLPYLGIYTFLSDEDVLLKLEEYKKKYGDMFSFTYTGRLYIHLSSIKAMREIQLQKSDYFGERFKDSKVIGQTLSNGLFMINGEPWKVLRKFFIQKFKEYGLNAVRDDLAGPLYDSLNAAIEDLKNSYKQPINIVDFLSQHCAVTLRKITFGENGVTNKEMTTMLTAFGRSFEGSFELSTLLNGPIAKFLVYTKPRLRESFKHANIMKSTVLGCVKRIESSMKEGEPRCIVEEFYKEKEERRRKNDPSWKYFSDEALVESLFQFIGDGILTLAGFIAGIFNKFLDYPEEQEKVYAEIMDVIGPNRHPTAEDRPNLPYTNAFLNECVRTSKFLTFFPSLECTKEATVRGYRIPTGSTTLLNFWSANHDQETFGDSNTFRPSRYLHLEGKPKTESPVLFGMGKRICTGEPYVMLQSFLFLATIVKNFKVISSNAQSGKSFEFLISGKLELTFAPRKEVP